MAEQPPSFATLLADPPWDIQQRGGGNIGADRPGWNVWGNEVKSDVDL